MPPAQCHVGPAHLLNFCNEINEFEGALGDQGRLDRHLDETRGDYKDTRDVFVTQDARKMNAGRFFLGGGICKKIRMKTFMIVKNKRNRKVRIRVRTNVSHIL